MKLIKFFLLLLIITNVSLTKTFSSENKILIDKISKNLRCLICQGQSVYDSQSEFALSMKLLIKEKLKEGSTEKEIYDFLKNQYGDWIVYDPKFDKKTLLLWGFPLVLFIFGGILIFRKVFIY
jgi:cytochrome c-type biogenesis protein CcmH